MKQKGNKCALNTNGYGGGNGTPVNDDGKGTQAHKNAIVENVNTEQKDNENALNTNGHGGGGCVHSKQKEKVKTLDIDSKTDGGDDTLVEGDHDEIIADKKYIEPRRDPTPLEQKKMFGKAIELLIKTGMENHVYRFQNKIRMQSSGGPIGLALTGEVADCYMLRWDERFKDKLKMLGIKLLLYSRLKDDILIATECLEKGTKFSQGKLVLDEQKEKEDENKTDTKITMEVLEDVANSVDNMIKFTHDTPCSYKDNKMPALDIKVNVNEEMQNRIDYEFFEKPTKNPRVLLADSAISTASKRTILTQECLRRMRNTKVELGEICRNKHLNDFMVKLKNSGYSEKFRKEIMNSAWKAFEKMLDEDAKGTKPLFRHREWNRKEREKFKKSNKLKWYKNTKNSEIEYRSVLFVPPTPGGILAKELKIRENEINRNSKERIKIVEKSGQSIESMLSNKDPFEKENCLEEACPICKNPEKKKNLLCNTNNVGYRWICSTCKTRDKVKVYEGETSRSARLRGKEHLDGYRRQHVDNVFYKHKMTEHENEDANFSMEITGRFRDALTRQADEAVRIHGRNDGELLNSKSEFNHPPIARVVIQRNNKKLVRPGL